MSAFRVSYNFEHFVIRSSRTHGLWPDQFLNIRNLIYRTILKSLVSLVSSLGLVTSSCSRVSEKFQTSEWSL